MADEDDEEYDDDSDDVQQPEQPPLPPPPPPPPRRGIVQKIYKPFNPSVNLPTIRKPVPVGRQISPTLIHQPNFEDTMKFASGESHRRPHLAPDPEDTWRWPAVSEEQIHATMDTTRNTPLLIPMAGESEISSTGRAKPGTQRPIKQTSSTSGFSPTEVTEREVAHSHDGGEVNYLNRNDGDSGEKVADNSHAVQESQELTPVHVVDSVAAHAVGPMSEEMFGSSGEGATLDYMAKTTPTPVELIKQKQPGSSTASSPAATLLAKKVEPLITRQTVKATATAKTETTDTIPNTSTTYFVPRIALGEVTRFTPGIRTVDTDSDDLTSPSPNVEAGSSIDADTTESTTELTTSSFTFTTLEPNYSSNATSSGKQVEFTVSDEDMRFTEKTTESGNTEIETSIQTTVGTEHPETTTSITTPTTVLTTVASKQRTLLIAFPSSKAGNFTTTTYRQGKAVSVLGENGIVYYKPTILPAIQQSTFGSNNFSSMIGSVAENMNPPNVISIRTAASVTLTNQTTNSAGENVSEQKTFDTLSPTQPSVVVVEMTPLKNFNWRSSFENLQRTPTTKSATSGAATPQPTNLMNTTTNVVSDTPKTNQTEIYQVPSVTNPNVFIATVPSTDLWMTTENPTPTVQLTTSPTNRPFRLPTAPSVLTDPSILERFLPTAPSVLNNPSLGKSSGRQEHTETTTTKVMEKNIPTAPSVLTDPSVERATVRRRLAPLRTTPDPLRPLVRSRAKSTVHHTSTFAHRPTTTPQPDLIETQAPPVTQLEESQVEEDPLANQHSIETLLETETVTEENFFFSPATTNTIIISSVIGGCAILFFAFLMIFCMCKQKKLRRMRYRQPDYANVFVGKYG